MNSMPLDIYQRIEMAKKTTRLTNCNGTALYIVGEHPKDEYIDIIPTLDYHKTKHPQPITYISDMEKIPEAEHNSIVLFRERIMNDLPRHMGAVVLIGEQLRLIHRSGWNGLQPLKDDLLDDILNMSLGNEIIEFYRPRQ
jgi:hypothetical protein